MSRARTIRNGRFCKAAGSLRRIEQDDRFLSFVFATMAISVVMSSIAAAIAELFAGSLNTAGAILVIGPLGGFLLFMPMLVVGFLPSLLTFSVIWRLTCGEARLPLSAEYAGVATAAAASVFWVALLTFMGGDGAETVVGVVGIAAILIAPRVARWAYRDKGGNAACPAEFRIG